MKEQKIIKQLGTNISIAVHNQVAVIRSSHRDKKNIVPDDCEQRARQLAELFYKEVLSIFKRESAKVMDRGVSNIDRGIISIDDIDRWNKAKIAKLEQNNE